MKTTILVKRATGIKMETNSMLEKELSHPMNLRDMGLLENRVACSSRTVTVPDYLDHGIVITNHPLYQYLNA